MRTIIRILIVVPYLFDLLSAPPCKPIKIETYGRFFFVILVIWFCAPPPPHVVVAVGDIFLSDQ